MFAIETASFLLLSIISVWSAESEFTCPRLRGYFPHPQQCKKYYVCMNNKSILETCPDQMLFDIKKRSCFTRSKVNCGERIQDDQTEMPANDSNIAHTFSEVLLNVTFTPLQESFNVTNVTSNTQATSIDDSEWIVTNNTHESVTDTTSYVISNDSTDASREENITYIKLEWVTDSNKFENITNVIMDVNSTVVPAISDIVTDNKSDEFEWISSVSRFENATDSTVNVTSTVAAFTKETTREESTEFKWVTSFSSLENVTDFVSNEISTLVPSPSKTDFTGDDAKKTESITETITTTLNSYDDDDYTEDIYICPEAYGLYPHPTDRHKYIHCQEWYPHILTCPANLVFDNIKKVCVWRIKRH